MYMSYPSCTRVILHLLSLYFITNTHIYIYTLQGLRYPSEALQFLAYIHYDDTTPNSYLGI